MVDGFQKARRFAFAALTAVLSGCAGGSPFGGGPSDAFSTANGFDDPNRAPYSQLAQAFPEQDVAGPGSQLVSRRQKPGVIGSMQRMARSFTDAVTPEPHVIPPDDPTSLASPDPDVTAQLNYHAARVYESQNRIPGAIALYQKSLRADPNATRTLIGYARLLDRQGNFGEAENLYRRALQVEPTNTVALNDLGMMNARQGRLAQAVEVVGAAVQLQPMNQRYRNNMATVLIDSGRVDEAFGHLAAVHGEASAHYNLGVLLSQRQMNAEAIHHVNQALTLNPHLQPARSLAEQLTAAPAGRAINQPAYQPVSVPVPRAQPSMQRPAGTRPLPPL